MAVTGQGRRKSVTVVPSTPTPLLDSFTFDLTRSMSVSYSGTLTQHPVQNGAEGVVDMYIVDPPEVSISGVLANTPIESMAGGLSDFFSILDAGTDRMVSLTELLIQLHQRGILCTVYMSWHRPLQSYMPSVVDLSRDQSSGNSTPVTVKFSKVRIVNEQIVPAQQDSDILALSQSRLEFGPVTFE